MARGRTVLQREPNNSLVRQFVPMLFKLCVFQDEAGRNEESSSEEEEDDEDDDDDGSDGSDDSDDSDDSEDAEPEPDHMLDTQEEVVEHTVAVHTEAEHTEAVAVLAVEGNFEHIQEVVR